MKYFIFGDVHGTSLQPLEEEIESQIKDGKRLGIKQDISIICLGDFDTTSTVHQTRKLQKKYGGVVVPGNHDEMIFNGEYFFSPTFGPNRNAFTCMIDFQKDKPAKAYLEHLLYGTEEPGLILSAKQLFSKIPAKAKDLLEARIKRIPIYSERFKGITIPNAIVVHAGFAGDLSGTTTKSKERNVLWYRLYDDDILDEEAAENNFGKIDDSGCNMLIRGHDHVQSYVYKREDGSIEVLSEQNQGFNLYPERMHIINPGAYFDGLYAVIDTDFPVPGLSFHKLE